MIRVDPDRFVEIFYSLGIPGKTAVGETPVIPCIRKAGIQRDSLIESDECIFISPCLEECCPLDGPDICLTRFVG